MKKLIFILLISFGVQSQTLTVSGTTYEITASELLNNLNSYNEGRNSRFPFTAPVNVTLLANAENLRNNSSENQLNIHRASAGGDLRYRFQPNERHYIIIATSEENARNLNGFVSIVVGATYTCCGDHNQVYLADDISSEYVWPGEFYQTWRLYQINIE